MMSQQTTNNKQQTKNIGLLGGSFNPPHKGHIHIANQALKYLNLDEVWWVISYKHPFKDNNTNLHDFFNKRVVASKEITKDNPNIKICTIEQDISKDNKLSYTIDIINKLKENFKSNNFIWLLGSDNAENLHKWHKIDDLLKLIPFCFFYRPKFNLDFIKNSEFGKKNKNLQIDYQNIFASPPPSWSYIDIEGVDISSTSLGYRFSCPA